MRFCSLLLAILVPVSILCQDCDPVFDAPLSVRNANYTMDVVLDHKQKSIEATQRILWVNLSPDTLSEIRFYMYINAFKNTESTFLKGIDDFFGEDITRRTAEQWGWITVDEMHQNGKNISKGLRYIQPNDGNPLDQTVLQAMLAQAVLPGDTVILDLKFRAKLPKTIVRTGYSKDDFFLFVHWFPQVGVYEADASGHWGWNCHQFHRSTEFYSDFGTYEVTLTTSDHLVIGASGCRIKDQKNGDGTQTVTYYVEDVIDFAWVAYPFFEEHIRQWNHVRIRVLIPPEHAMHAERYLRATTQALEYLDQHVGRYPYTTITVVDPPFHALRSGLMEYPTFITAGSFYQLPAGIKTLESLVVHEFAHQYFMGMLASNEKEQAWLDEGFVTYFEDQIGTYYFGEKSSLFDLLGYRAGNAEITRHEYTGMPNPSMGIIDRPGWEFETWTKSLTYSKTATMLQTLRGLVGAETMDVIIKTYFERWKFRHPRGRDFEAVANEVVTKRYGQKFGENLDWFFEPILRGTEVCDYAVTKVENKSPAAVLGLFDENGELRFKSDLNPAGNVVRVELHRLGGLIFPLEIELEMEDGSILYENWDGRARMKVLEFKSDLKVRAVRLDPKKKIYLDLDFNNNSIVLKPETSVLYKYAAKVIFWTQHLIQSIGFLI